ncbi:MAG TPA: GNAT family N-acetyltransferase [Nocardioides sp.]|nr:GNAT family N-acetyltransferase [Nocardioides sp.]
MSLRLREEQPACGTVLTRLAEPEDYPAIRAVILAAYGEYETAIGPDAYDRYLEDLLDLELHARNGPLIVAEVDGVIRGSGAFYPDAAAQGLGWPSGWAGGRGLAVHPTARRQGVAQALLGAAESLAHEYGAPVFAFHTIDVMSGAIALYKSLGYCRAPEFDHDLRPHFGTTAGRPIQAIAFRRDLTTSGTPHHHRVTIIRPDSKERR